MAVTVVKSLAIIKDTAGRQQYFYQGAVLPQGLDPADVKRLADEGYLVDDKPKS